MMHDIALEAPHDFGAFREAVRRLLAGAVPPHDVAWRDAAESGLLGAASLPSGAPVMVPAGFARMAEDVICHRDADRLALLYQLVWRLTHGERHLLSVVADPLVHRLTGMQKAIGRDIHKMHAFVRFRQVPTDEGEQFVAWFEPNHFIVARAAPFFVDRFTAMRWSILTPVGSAHWNGEHLTLAGPVDRRDAPASDDLEAWWRSYYRATFNPARANPQQMQAEMPKRYWRNLPEAALIPELLSQASKRTQDMVAAAPTTPRSGARAPIAPALPSSGATGLAELAGEAACCQRCPLFASATQTVFGRGPLNAEVMLVGEQPGDHEDLAGQAFVGPAGQLLDRALAAAGIERSAVYVTNAVKHFKFVPRGKKRIHKSPGRGEVEACKWWLERELALVRPRLVVALGATAAQALLGREVRVLSERGTTIAHPAGFAMLVTTHPSYLLRLTDAATREHEYAAFVRDLSVAATSRVQTATG